jgi:hypothetical protein
MYERVRARPHGPCYPSAMQLRSTWVLALLLGVLQPSVVHADAPRALMMAPMGDADEEMTSNAMTEVRATLEHQGVVFVVPPRGLSLECETQACRAAAAAAAGANVAVTVLVWQPTSFRAEGRVEVALTDVSGETVGAEVDFAADELLAAVQAARGALDRFGQRTRVLPSRSPASRARPCWWTGAPWAWCPTAAAWAPGRIASAWWPTARSCSPAR